jgi:hypothetical protein
MVAGPCCVFGATAPPANDSPVDAAAGRGAASDGSSSPDERSEEEQGGTDDEELLITEIVSHRDTRGEPNDPVLAYYTVRFAGLEDSDEEMEEELPEEELLRRAPKLYRDYRREVRRAAAAAAATAATATSGAPARPLRGRKSSRSDQGRGGGRARSRPWSHEEVARVVQVGREQRGMQLGEAGFKELAGQLDRTVKAVYAQWMRVQTPQKRRRASVAGGATGGARPKARRETSMGRGDGDEVGGAGYGAGAASDSTYELWKLTTENIALRAENRTLRDVLGLRGMGGFDAQQGRERHRGSRGSYERSASRSPPRDRYDPFASQHF